LVNNLRVFVFELWETLFPRVSGLVVFSPVLLKESQAKIEKQVEGSKGTLLPGLGLVFGLSEIG
jgi:hypothetical protein